MPKAAPLLTGLQKRLTEGLSAGNLPSRDQQPYQPRIEELRSQRHEVYRQASKAGPEALQPESPYYRQVESLITKITAMHMEMGDWP
jgi:hypothetical protein